MNRHEGTGLAIFVSSIVMLSSFQRGLRLFSASRMPIRLAGTQQPPVAKKVSGQVYFGANPNDPEQERGKNPMKPPKVREDVYGWLRDDERKRRDVLDYLEAENKYAEQHQAHLQGLRNELYEEMLSHLKQTDEDVPHRDGDFLYYSKTQEGLSYKIHCRKGVNDNTETVVIDENKLAAGHEYSDMSMYAPSPSHTLVAYTVDHSGYETYSMHVVEDIATGRECADVLEGIDGTVVWGADDSTIFYTTMDEEHRPYKLHMHILGTPQSEDVCLFTEDDGMYWMGIEKTADDQFLLLTTESKETSEVHAISLRGVAGAAGHRQAAQRLVCLRPREFGVRYAVEHHEGSFFITTNLDGAKNNKLVSCPVSAYYNIDSMTPLPPQSVTWNDVKPYNAARQIDDLVPFKTFIAVLGRESGTQRLWIIHRDGSAAPADGEWKPVSFPESLYSIWPGDNYVYDSKLLRLGYSSLLTPKRVIDYDVQRGATQVLKEVEVPHYDASQYECQRLFATARDGTKVPMSVVFHKKALDATGKLRERPVLLYGYGSYGSCIDPYFDFKRTALLDRGVVYVIAHIRGGGEMGREWYEDHGKYLTKMNTFNDFIDCGQYLVDSGITKSDRLAIVGRSAGGLLIGAVCNMRPQLFKAAVADVPFVDVVNTMSDPTIPLTVTEWEEWGNPNEEKYFDYMLQYSPYDNVKAQAYPSMLITAGLNDPRVPYWEPAKWCAKLRATKTDANPLLLKTDMSSGHFSASDRYKFIKETAFEYAFILEQIGATKRL